MDKTYYYHFNNFDTTFWAIIIAFLIAIFCCCCCPYAWGVFLITILLWCYKHIRHKAIRITDKTIQIDLSAPLAWKDIKKAEVKNVHMGYKKYKILSLIPKDKIKYHYNWLQKHNRYFGAFAVPLYGILTQADEKEIVKFVKEKVK